MICGVGMVGITSLLESCKKVDTSPQGPTVNFTLDLTLAANAPLNNNGGSVSTQGVVIANASGTYVAVAQACTHAGCSVGYNKSGNDFVCPCHGGTYDLKGNVTAGPPPAPLKSYTVTKNGNVLTVTG